MTVMTSEIASQSSIQEFVQTDQNKHRFTVPLWEESTGDRWIPHKKGQ